MKLVTQMHNTMCALFVILIHTSVKLVSLPNDNPMLSGYILIHTSVKLVTTKATGLDAYKTF